MAHLLEGLKVIDLASFYGVDWPLGVVALAELVNMLPGRGKY